MQWRQPSSSSDWQSGQRVNVWFWPQCGQKLTVRPAGSRPPQKLQRAPESRTNLGRVSGSAVILGGGGIGGATAGAGSALKGTRRNDSSGASAVRGARGAGRASSSGSSSGGA
jgi:hypothetical protein